MTTANECYRPPIDAQLRYTVQWFHEWSEMQRGDFLPILAQKLAPASYVNGLISGMDSLGCGEGRPPSLFQCRVKLFREWVDTWSESEREQLLRHIKSMDPGFHARVEEELRSCNGDNDKTRKEDEDSPGDQMESLVQDEVEQLQLQAQEPLETETQASAPVPDVIAPIVNSNSIVQVDETEPEAEVKVEVVEAEPEELEEEPVDELSE